MTPENISPSQTDAALLVEHQEAAEPGVFTQGSILRHVIVMSATGSIGLMAIFSVDLLNLLYISWLKTPALTAAVGYASTLLFALVSVSIGITIAISAVVSNALGARQRAKARELSGSGLFFSFVIMSALTLIALPLTGTFLHLLGAEGDADASAYRFMMQTLPTMPLLAIGMAFTGILRAVGDAKRAMWVTLSSAIATVFLDPLFIFWMKLGLDGAAIVIVIARIAMLAIGSYAVFHIHDLVRRPHLKILKTNFRELSAIALPVIATNIATPVANGYITSAISSHGNNAVTAWTIISRLIPVAFGATFALSGAVGPILGQNLGARFYDRLMRTMQQSLMIVAVYVLCVWLLLFVLQDQLLVLFNAEGEAAELIRFYCSYVAGSFIFMGALFTANACFNNLGFPLMSTFFNWARATAGTVPFVWYFGKLYGAKGVLLGQGLGAAIFGIGAAAASLYLIRRIERRAADTKVL